MEIISNYWWIIVFVVIGILWLIKGIGNSSSGSESSTDSEPCALTGASGCM